MFAHRRVCRFQIIQTVVFFREAEQGNVKMSEFMQRRAGFGNVDAVLAKDIRTDAVDAQLPTEVCRIIAVDDKFSLKASRIGCGTFRTSSRNLFALHCIRFSTATGVSGGVTVRFCVRTA